MRETNMGYLHKQLTFAKDSDYSIIEELNNVEPSKTADAYGLREKQNHRNDIIFPDILFEYRDFFVSLQLVRVQLRKQKSIIKRQQ